MSAFGGKADMSIALQNVRSLTSSNCKLGFDISRQFSAVGSELYHDLFVQPDIHLGWIFGVAGIVQFFGKLFTR
jgi:hypothetical protein